MASWHELEALNKNEAAISKTASTEARRRLLSVEASRAELHRKRQERSNNQNETKKAETV